MLLMRTKIIILTTLIFGAKMLSAQNIDLLLDQIEKNNSTLKTYRDANEALKLENKSGISLANPEVEFAYMWGAPKTEGNEIELSISQSFDMATVLGTRRNLADKQNKLVDVQYRVDRMTILFEAKNAILNLIYYNALEEELKVRYDYAQMLADAYTVRLEKGDANILEYNKAMLNLATAEGELQRVNIEQQNLQAELKRLNRGVDLEIPMSEYEIKLLPISFDEWYAQAEAKSPALEYIRQEIEINNQNIKLAKTLNLPKLSLGYAREQAIGGMPRMQGFVVGTSIPLWANKNRVKSAKTYAHAIESKQEDAKIQFYNNLKRMYERTTALQRSANAYRLSLSNLNNSDLLQKALDAGKISLLDYIVEIGLYYNTVNSALIAERDAQLALAELNKTSL